MSQVDGIWHEGRYSGVVNAHFLKIMLKIISMDSLFHLLAPSDLQLSFGKPGSRLII